MDLRIKLLRGAVLPQYSREGDAALDLRATMDAEITVAPGGRAEIGSGVAMAIPAGHVGVVVPRSGTGKRGLHLANATGVIDSNYRGEIMLNVVNTGVESMTIQPGDRIMQLLITPVATCTILQADELDETNRGTGGFGSSGR